ncbi:MAG: efflux RND transporter periplasmic adaptor subunit [Betaproteobacteria bacterium]
MARSGLARGAWLSLSLCACTPEATEKPVVVLPVLAVKVGLSQHSSSLSLAGEVRPRTETSIGFRVAGKLIERKVDVGTQVKRGDILARLDPQDLSLQTQATGAQSAAAQTELAQQVADLERFQSLLKQGFISQAEFDRRKNTAEIARSRVAEVGSVQRSSRNQLDYAVIRADEAGIVTAVLAERGQVVAAGQPVLRMAQAGPKEIAVTVAESRLEALQTARGLVISLSAVPGKTYKGTLRELSPVADPATRTYAARITVLNADDAMRLGMSARVEVHGDGMPTLMLPLTALYRNGDKTAVWLVDPATFKVELANVTVTSVQDDGVAIGLGLKEGDTVVTAGVQKLMAGQKVRVVAP